MTTASKLHVNDRIWFAVSIHGIPANNLIATVMVKSVRLLVALVYVNLMDVFVMQGEVK